MSRDGSGPDAPIVRRSRIAIAGDTAVGVIASSNGRACPPLLGFFMARALPAGSPGAGAPAATGTFASPPTFGTSGQALAVFLGGSVADLEIAAKAAGATGVWAQDANGAFQVLVLGGPSFINDGFRGSFPGGFPANTALTLTR